ncbi:MAG: PIN domain-containing protein [Candidatus Woesearchaeota archaeon]|nr:MAG: PIN domain-containing protein [Candidatus Woesearchaeota archaeon]
MVEKYYIDTAIWVDLYENRKGYAGEPLGDFAFKLFVIIKAKQNKIVITDLTIRELEMNYSIPEINGMMKPFEAILEKVIASEDQCNEAKKIAEERNVPRGDALHAVIARDNRFILITRDNHFKRLTDVSQHHKPEDII